MVLVEETNFGASTCSNVKNESSISTWWPKTFAQKNKMFNSITWKYSKRSFFLPQQPFPLLQLPPHRQWLSFTHSSSCHNVWSVVLFSLAIWQLDASVPASKSRHFVSLMSQKIMWYIPNCSLAHEFVCWREFSIVFHHLPQQATPVPQDSRSFVCWKLFLTDYFIWISAHKGIMKMLFIPSFTLNILLSL